MGTAASTRRERKGPPKTLVSKLDGETRAFDIMKLMDQDTIEADRESKRRAVLDELEQVQASAMVQLTTRHVAEVDELVALHKARVDALYEQVSGLVTPTEMYLAGPAHHANARAQMLLWRSQRHASPIGRMPSPPPSAVNGRLPQSRQQLRLAELGLLIASLPPGRAAGMQAGLRTLSALDAVHQTELEELEVTQQQEIAAAQIHARYERAAALYKIEYIAQGDDEAGDDDKNDQEEDVDDEVCVCVCVCVCARARACVRACVRRTLRSHSFTHAKLTSPCDEQLARLTDEIYREGTAISDVDQEGRSFSDMNRTWSEIKDAKLSQWRRSASPPAQRGASSSFMRGCRPSCCAGGANADENQVETLVLRSMAVENIRPYLEPELPEEVKWTDVENFLMEENEAPDVEAVTADPNEYAQHLCFVRMPEKQLALQDVD